MFKITDSHIKEAITKIRSEGRLQNITQGKLRNYVSKNNRILIDGAHNPLAALEVEKYLKKIKANYFCGEESDVVNRFYRAAKKYNAKIIVRITADCPLVDAKIVDENGDEVLQGEEGRLLIRGDSTCKYYWNNEQKTAETISDEWLNTGDTYHQDKEGYYFYGGRSDDMMKVGGIWCSPFEIEARLVEHPKVLEAAVVGREDDAGLIKPEAHVVLNNSDEEIDSVADELLDH